MYLVSIRFATKEDVPFILEMIQYLADYENATNRVMITEGDLLRDGFSEFPLFKSIILEYEGKNAGMALFYNRYSTWRGKNLYLEDLFVLPEYRGKKIGLKAMKYLANYAIETGCKRFEWQVLDWNVPSINFYKSFQTELDSEWINCRLEDDALYLFAEKE